MGQRFGNYLLLRRIAVGGMAEIFVARREGMEGFQKTIVIKRIRPHLSEQAAFVNMFLNEARLAAELIHSNIAQIYDLGRVGKSYFIAMEYVNGRDMRAIIPQAEKLGIFFPLEYSLKVARDVCEGLYYAHRKTDDQGHPLHIVHRDVTPENVMVSFDGEVKILDFGVAKAENLVSETRVGEVKGKLGYLSPEQITGKSVDHRSDIFSLGVVLYELLTARRLFTGATDMEVLKSVVEGRIYPPTYLKEDIPAAVEKMVMRALERTRELRYQSAWDMLADIDQFLAGHRFVPTNIHLSNFLRQIFARELEQRAEEKELEEQEPAAEERRVESRRTEVVDATPARKILARPDGTSAEIPSAGDGNRRVTLLLDARCFEVMKQLAERNRLSLPEFIEDVLNHYAGWLGGSNADRLPEQDEVEPEGE